MVIDDHDRKVIETYLADLKYPVPAEVQAALDRVPPMLSVFEPDVDVGEDGGEEASPSVWPMRLAPETASRTAPGDWENGVGSVIVTAIPYVRNTEKQRVF